MNKILIYSLFSSYFLIIMVSIYILQLENNKYYVGKTNNPDIRVASHFDSNGSEWTKIYKPIKVYEIISNCDSYDEDKYTLKYMEQKGIDNVRGGSFSQVELSNEQNKFISQMIKGATDKCFNCGESGHFVKECMELKVSEHLETYLKKTIAGSRDESMSLNSYQQTLNLVYEEILELESLIPQLILPDDWKHDLEKEIQNQKEINKLYEDHRTKDYGKDTRAKSLRDSQLHEISQKNECKNRIGQLICHRYRIFYQAKSLNNAHRNNADRNDADRNDADRRNADRKDPIIKGLEILKFSLEKEKRLNDIYDTYYNKEFVIKLLSKIYERQIEILKEPHVIKKKKISKGQWDY